MAVEQAESGPQALGACSATATDGTRFDVAVVDSGMRHAVGFELAGAIKQDDPLAETDGGDADQPGVQVGEWLENRKRGVAANVSKPVKQSELFNTLMEVVGRAASNPRGSRQPDDAPVPHARGLRVLLAEDNPVNQTLAVLLLQKRGHQVTVADNGREAVERVASRSRSTSC